MSQDSVDRLIAGWRRARPSFDVASLGVIARLSRVRRMVDEETERLLGAHGLTGPSFALLATLTRLAAPEGVSQRRLADELGLTAGTVSVRVDRLVGDGLVTRGPDPEDRRNTLIGLTERGREVSERAIPAHLANQRRLLAPLSDGERDALAHLLGRLLGEYEGVDTAGPALGMRLAPSHVTIAMRQAVGLPGDPGLLVQAVDPDGPAARAGILAGDVITAADGTALRSLAELGAHLDAWREATLAVELIRGTEPALARISL